jgi:hypothetical protein
MSIGAILVGIGFFVLVVAYVARPLFERNSQEGQGHSVHGNSRTELLARRDAVYALIRELDADFETGKINNEDYQAQRERYVAEGVSILRQIDATQGKKDRAVLDAEIEARVLALREGLAFAPTFGDQPAPRFCTHCGQPADPEDRFCAQCGAALKGISS